MTFLTPVFLVLKLRQNGQWSVHLNKSNESKKPKIIEVDPYYSKDRSNKSFNVYCLRNFIMCETQIELHNMYDIEVFTISNNNLSSSSSKTRTEVRDLHELFLVYIFLNIATITNIRSLFTLPFKS